MPSISRSTSPPSASTGSSPRPLARCPPRLDHQPAMQVEKDHRSDHRARQTTEIERLGIADPQQLGEDQVAHGRPGEAEEERRQQTSRRAARGEDPSDPAGEKAEDDRADHGPILCPPPGRGEPGQKKRPPRGAACSQEPAATYSPRRLPSKYHRR
jgi:hypothetical protein